MTYNIRYDNPHDGINSWSNRKEKVCNIILDNEIDIIGIQEGLYHQVRYLEESLDHYSYVGVGRDDGMQKGEFSAIFYKTDKFNILKSGTFWLSETPDTVSTGWDAAMERICTWAVFEATNSKDHLWVFNTHFDHIGDTARLESARLILQQISKLNKHTEAVILMGDFNASPSSPPIVNIISAGYNNATEKSLPTYNGFKQQKTGTQIDFIFYKQLKKLSDSIILTNDKGLFPSDHFPVTATFSIK